MLDREVRELANLQGRSELPRLLRLAATRSMGLLNFASLARDAAMPQTTLQRYWALLEATFLVSTLPPWSANLGTRLVKAPKVLLGDPGLLCYLAGLDRTRLLGDDLMAGPVLEAFAASEVVKQATWSRTQPSLYHYRTHTQREVDLVLEDAAGRLVGIEVKRTASPGSDDFRGLRHLREQTGKRFVRGVLLHTGAAAVSFEGDLHALPVSVLWEMGCGETP
jgi:predicted AAA+ superfamily ATPase